MSTSSPWIERVNDERRIPALKGSIPADVATAGGGTVGVMTPEKREVHLFAGARKELKYVLFASALALIFWLLQFANQYLFLIPGELEGSILRSFALSGATLISLALIIGPLRTLLPKYNFLVHRRTVGVWGFTFIIMHFITVTAFLFDFDLSRLLWNSNPLANPLLFSIGSFPVFVAMWATSTDWAVQKLSFKRWKFLHRFVFLAYIGAVAHYSLINPELLYNPAGYLLIGVTILALGLELGAYVKTVNRKGFGKGGVIGLLIILFAASIFTAAFGFREDIIGEVEPNPDLPLSMAMVRMTDFMAQKGGNQSISVIPIEEDQSFEGEMSRSGEFVKVNYMTSGQVTLETRGGNSFVVFGDDFSTPNGPDLVVYLTKNSDPSTRADIQEGIVLSSLKSTTGKQVYEIPNNIDLSEYNSVTIHCRAFNVPWSYVPFA